MEQQNSIQEEGPTAKDWIELFVVVSIIVSAIIIKVVS